MAIFLLLQQVDLNALGPALAHAERGPIVVVVVCVLVSLLTRAARWQNYFLPDQRVPFRPLVETLAISYMASTFLPLRAGELVRAVFLGKRQMLPVPRVVGTILLEKLFDFLAIGVMLAVLVVRIPVSDSARAAGLTIATAILIGFGIVVALAIWRAPMLSLIALVESHLPFQLGRRLRLAHVARQFAEGTDSLREARLWAPLLAWTIVTWLLALGSGWGGIAALGVQPDLSAVLLLTVLTSTGQAVPSSPGYVGVYHFWAVVALTAFGIDPTTALAIALVTHAFSYGCLVVAGLIALWTGGYTLGDVFSGVRGQQSRPTGSSISAEPLPLAPDL